MLSTELYYIIFSYCDVIIINNIEQSCKYFHEIINSKYFFINDEKYTYSKFKKNNKLAYDISKNIELNKYEAKNIEIPNDEIGTKMKLFDEYILIYDCDKTHYFIFDKNLNLLEKSKNKLVYVSSLYRIENKNDSYIIHDITNQQTINVLKSGKTKFIKIENNKIIYIETIGLKTYIINKNYQKELIGENLKRFKISGDLISYQNENKIFFYHYPTNKVIYHFEENDCGYPQIYLSSKYAIIKINTWEKLLVKIINLKTLKIKYIYLYNYDYVRSHGVHKNILFIECASFKVLNDKMLFLYDVKTGQIMRKFKIPKQISKLKFSDNIIMSFDRNYRLYKI